MSVRAALVVSLLLAVAPARADGDAAERARISAERDVITQRHAAEERECQTRFAVNDCLRAARKRRGDALADLRRQEQTLDDAARRQRAAQRQVELDERQSPEAREADARERLAAQQARVAQAEQDAARRAARAASAARTAEAPRPQRRQPDAEAARREREAFEAREREARERKARVLERAAKPRKPASGLPPPVR